MKKIRFLMPYMGKWPPWFELYLETCRWNPTIEWLFFTDCPPPQSRPDNVSFLSVDLAALSQQFSQKLGIDIRLRHAYKLCDFKPLYGFLFSEFLNDVDHWGHGDIDVFYGNLRGYFTDELLAYKVVSMHRRLLSGHLALYQNRPEVNELFRRVEDWPTVLRCERCLKLDETLLPDALKIGHFREDLLKRHWSGPPVGIEEGFYFHESWNTPRFYLNDPLSLRRLRWATPQDNRLWRGQRRIPDVWYWARGRLTNNVDADELPYLHFKNWLREDWKHLKRLLRADLGTLKAGFRVSRYGILGLEQPEPPWTLKADFHLKHVRARAASRVASLLERQNQKPPKSDRAREMSPINPRLPKMPPPSSLGGT